MLSGRDQEFHLSRNDNSPDAPLISHQNEDLSYIERNHSSAKSILFRKCCSTNSNIIEKEKKRKSYDKKSKRNVHTNISQPEYVTIMPCKDEFIVAEIEISSTDEETDLIHSRISYLDEKTNNNSRSIIDDKDSTLLQLNNRVLTNLPNQDLADEIDKHKHNKTKKYHDSNTSKSITEELRKKKKVKQSSILCIDKIYRNFDPSWDKVNDKLKTNYNSNFLDISDLITFPQQTLNNPDDSTHKRTEKKDSLSNGSNDISKEKTKKTSMVLKNPVHSINYRSKASYKNTKINRSQKAIERTPNLELNIFEDDKCTNRESSCKTSYNKGLKNFSGSLNFGADFINKTRDKTTKVKKKINKNKMCTTNSGYLFDRHDIGDNNCNNLDGSSTKSVLSTQKINEKRLIAKFVRQPIKLTTTSKRKSNIIVETNPEKTEKKINANTDDTTSVFSWQYVLTERRNKTKDKNNKMSKQLLSERSFSSSNKTNRNKSIQRKKKIKTETVLINPSAVIKSVENSDVQNDEGSNSSKANNLILTSSKSMPYICPLASALENLNESDLYDIEDTFSWANLSSSSESVASVAYNAKTFDISLHSDGRVPRVLLRDIGNDLHKYKIYGQRKYLANESSSESSGVEQISINQDSSDWYFKPVDGFPKQRIPMSPLNLSNSTVSSLSPSRCSKINRHNTQNEINKFNEKPLQYKNIKENERLKLRTKSSAITNEKNGMNEENTHIAIKQALNNSKNYSVKVNKDERRIEISDYSKKIPIEPVTYKPCHGIPNKTVPPVKTVVSKLFSNLYKRVKSTLTSINRRSKKSELENIIENKHVVTKIPETDVVVSLLDNKCDNIIVNNKSVECNLEKDLETKYCNEIENCRNNLKKDVDFMNHIDKYKYTIPKITQTIHSQKPLIFEHQDMLPEPDSTKIEANCDSDIISLYADSFDARSFCSAVSIKTEFSEKEEKPLRTFVENYTDQDIESSNSKAIKLEDRFSTNALNGPFVAPLVAPNHLIYLKDAPAIMSPSFRLSILFRGVCVNNIIKSCPGETCKYPHAALSDKVIYDRLVQLQVLRFVDEYVHLRGHDSLYKIHLRLYFYVCYQKGLPNLLLEMMFDSAVFRMPDWVELAQIGLQLLNRADLERCKFFLLLYVQRKIFSELLIRVIVDSGNFIKYKDIFVKLSFVVITANSVVPIDLFSKILENVNVVPLDHDLLCAVYELLKITPRSIFRSHIMDNFLQRLEEHKMFFNLVMDLKRFAISRMDSFSRWANNYNIKIDFDDKKSNNYVVVSTLDADAIIKTTRHNNQANTDIKSEKINSRLRGKTRWDVVNHSVSPLKQEEITVSKDTLSKDQSSISMDEVQSSDKHTDPKQLPEEVRAGSNTEIFPEEPADVQMTEQKSEERRDDLCKRPTLDFGSYRKISASDIWDADSEDEVEQKRRKFDRNELERPTPQISQEDFPPRTCYQRARKNLQYRSSNRNQNGAGTHRFPPTHEKVEQPRHMNIRF